MDLATARAIRAALDSQVKFATHSFDAASLDGLCAALDRLAEHFLPETDYEAFLNDP